jgi:hypothetical protein
MYVYENTKNLKIIYEQYFTKNEFFLSILGL